MEEKRYLLVIDGGDVYIDDELIGSGCLTAHDVASVVEDFLNGEI